MAITTYAELQAAAANWLVRADLTARIPEFITLAEARLNRALRARLAETEQSLTAAVGARTIPLPTGFGEALVRFRGAPGEPAVWTIDGANLAFERPCDRAYGFVLRMLAKLQLTEAAPVNALLADWPDAYLFATLCEAAPFLRDPELAQAYESKLEAALFEINAKAARNRAPRTLSTEFSSPSSDFDIAGGV